MNQFKRSKAHHWWPKALSQFWENEHGKTHWVEPDGTLQVTQPKSLGFINHHNNIRPGDAPSVWDSSFESSFNDADSGIPALISWLSAIDFSICSRLYDARLSSVVFPRGIHLALCRCLVSLIVRSPSLRDRVRRTIESYRQELIGIKAPPASDSLVAINVRNGFETLSKRIATRGRFVILGAGNQEFVFGDGFLHNASVPPEATLALRCLIPLTPEIAIFFVQQEQSLDGPRAFALGLHPGEVEFVNWTVQVYAKQYIFFREIHPIIEEAFISAEHRQMPDHRHPRLDALEAAMNSFSGTKT